MATSTQKHDRNCVPVVDLNADENDPMLEPLTRQSSRATTAVDSVSISPAVSLPLNHPWWEPRILRRSTTVVVVLLLLLVIGGLEVLLRLSDSHTGFHVPSSGVLFFLTYGPVVAFVCMEMFWNSWELEIKKLVPWVGMQRGPVAAQDSILLDYVGANYISVLYRAATHKHWSVLLTILGSGMLSICSVFATSLWVISPQTMSQAVVLQQTVSLDAGSFNGSGSAAYIVPYLGNMLYNVTPRAWTYDGLAISAFQLNDDDLPAIVSAQTTGYSATLECEPVRISDAGRVIIGNPASLPSFMTSDPHVPTATYQADIAWRNCVHRVNITTVPMSSVGTFLDDNPLMYTYVGTMYDMTCDTVRASVLVVSLFDGNDTTPHEYSGTACLPKYTRTVLDVAINSSTSSLVGSPKAVSVPTSIELPLGDGLLYWIHHSNDDGPHQERLGSALDSDQNRFDAWPFKPYPVSSTTSDHVSNFELGSWLNLVTRVRNITEVDLMDPERIGNVSRDVFHDIFPYVALQVYAQPVQGPLNGLRVIQEDRIASKLISVRIVQSALCVLIVISLVLCFFHPNTRLRSDPGSLSATAVLLATSPGVEEHLAGTGAMDEKNFISHLDKLQCQTDVDEGGTLRMTARGPDVEDNADPAIPKASVFWRPMMLTWPARLILILILAIAIFVLEFSIQLSVRNDGIANVSDDQLQQYSWSYTAPVILFALSLSLSSFEKAIRVTEPYRRLAVSPQPYRVLGFNPLFASEYSIIPRSIRHGMPVITLAALLTIIVPLAKTVVAGVVVIGQKDVTTHLDLHIARQLTPGAFFTDLGGNVTGTDDILNTTTSASDYLSSDFEVWSFVRDPQYSFSRPAWTTKEYTIASVDLPSSLGTSIVSMRLPVAYASLADCQPVETRVRDPVLRDPKDTTKGFSFTFDFINYPSCHGLSGVVQPAMMPDGYFGFVWQGEAENEATSCNLRSHEVHFLFGETPSLQQVLDKSVSPTSLKVSHLVCINSMTMSSMVVNVKTGSTNPEILSVNRSSEQNATDITSSALYSYFNEPNIITIPRNTSLDIFFSGIIASEPSTPLAAYLDVSYLETVVLDGWSDIFALQLDQSMRTTTGTETLAPVQATQTIEIARLTIDPTPAQALAGVLGLIFIIVCVISIVVPARSALYKPPYSIAAQMSLLAHSRLVHQFKSRTDAEKWEGNDAQHLPLVQLAWWDDASAPGSRRYGLDAVDAQGECVPLAKEV